MDTPDDIADTSTFIAEAEALALDALALARDTLLARYRFCSRALGAAPARLTRDTQSCAIRNGTLTFAPLFTLRCLHNNQPLLARSYLHMLLHLALGHVNVPAGVDRLRWSVACDLSVEALLAGLESDAIHFESPERVAACARVLERAAGATTAPALYRVLSELGLSDGELAQLQLVVGTDDHSSWFEDSPDASPHDPAASDAPTQASVQWQRIAQHMLRELRQESLGAAGADVCSQQLAALVTEPLSLEELLRIYAAPQESMVVDTDSFDPIYYSYGLALYGNVPLIEALESREQPCTREFCIAIDTSGSVQGAQVRAFCRRAAGAIESLSDAVAPPRIRLLQCDCVIQEEFVAESPEALLRHLDVLELKGFGGTDFRPVFERLEEVVATSSDEFAGLIYFTDGLGTFPEHAPSFDAAFVFVNEPRPVPGWASAAVVYTDELGY